MIRLLTTTLTLLTAAQAFASDPFPVTRDEYKRYHRYQNAMADPRVQKMKESARLPAVARDQKMKPKDLEALVEKVEGAGDLKAKCEAGMKEAAAAAGLKGVTGKIMADLAEEHGVAYLQWMNESPDKLNIEACEAARAAVDGCPVVSSVEVYAQDKANQKKRVFEGLISATAAENIKINMLKDFAETRYIRLFEKVRSVNAGDTFADEEAAPTAPKPSGK